MLLWESLNRSFCWNDDESSVIVGCTRIIISAGSFHSMYAHTEDRRDGSLLISVQLIIGQSICAGLCQADDRLSQIALAAWEVELVVHHRRVGGLIPRPSCSYGRDRKLWKLKCNRDIVNYSDSCLWVWITLFSLGLVTSVSWPSRDLHPQELRVFSSSSLCLAKICLCTMITDGSCWQPTCLTFLVCQQWPGPSVYLYGFRLWSVFLKVWEERRFPLKKSVCFVGTNEWLNISNQSHFPHAIQRKKYQISIYYMTISNIHWGHIICHTINGARKKVTHTL